MSLGRFRSFADKFPEGILLLSSLGEILSANRAACRLLQRPLDELIHQNLGQIISGDQAALAERLKPCSRSRVPVRVALQFTHVPEQKGSSIQATAFLFTPATGSSPAQILLKLQRAASSSNQFAVLKQDVVQLNKTMRLLSQGRETLRASEEKLAIILSSIGNGVITTDVNGVITFVNPAARQMLRYELDETLGQEFPPLLHHTRVDGTRYPVEESPIAQAYRQGEFSQVDDKDVPKACY